MGRVKYFSPKRIKMGLLTDNFLTRLFRKKQPEKPVEHSTKKSNTSSKAYSYSSSHDDDYEEIRRRRRQDEEYQRQTDLITSSMVATSVVHSAPSPYHYNSSHGCSNTHSSSHDSGSSSSSYDSGSSSSSSCDF